MPLRDHFRPPVDDFTSWEGFHAMWPARIVLQLRNLLPKDFVAEPRVHSGPRIEVDIAAIELDDVPDAKPTDDSERNSSTSWHPSPATLTLDPEVVETDEYEVRIYDARRRRQLVAAIEIVSPANKDRADSRETFVAKCVALLRQGVAVSVVDLVTTKYFNLGAQILAVFRQHAPTFTAVPATIYALSYRCLQRKKATIMDVESHILTVGQPLPIIPLWLAPNLVLPLDLEMSYEQACNDLAIP